MFQEIASKDGMMLDGCYMDDSRDDMLLDGCFMRLHECFRRDGQRARDRKVGNWRSRSIQSVVDFDAPSTSPASRLVHFDVPSTSPAS